MKKHALCAFAAACLWGLIGLFSRNLSALGFSSSDTPILRCGVAALCFGITLLARDRGGFRIRLKDLWCFPGTGLCSLLFFTFCSFQAIERMEMSGTAIAGAVAFSEPMTRGIGLGMLLTLCAIALLSLPTCRKEAAPHA